jgi:hypothetical protein
MRFCIALVLFVTSTLAMATECLSYSGQVTLMGTLSRHTFPEQPNYESIAKGDAKATYFFVSMHSPICVAEGSSGDELEDAEKNIMRVQLLLEPKGYAALRPHIGKEIKCSGNLFHAISGHHHSPVLLENTICSLPKQ